MDCAERTNRCQYVEALEEERRKIQVFQRELPLCLELVIRAIETCKKELSGTAGRSDCSEQTSSDAPVLEEFIPIKRIGCREAEDDEDDDRSSSKRSKKSDWLRSVRLWNQSPDPSPPTLNKEKVPRKAVVKRNGTGGAFQPFQRDKAKTRSSDGKKNGNGGEDASSDKVAVPATSSSAETVGNGGGTTTRKEDKDAGGERKQRRCWSPELHRRFLIALQQLGGSHAATPKQIRELMKVDGLTNDEVKSHLQKYRLHTRRPSPTIHNRLNPQAPQFVVVGGIWVPPPEFGAPTGDAATIPALQPPHSATVVARKAERQRVQVSGSDSQGGHVLCN